MHLQKSKAWRISPDSLKIYLFKYFEFCDMRATVTATSYNSSDLCSICEGHLDSIWDLPGLPLTGIFQSPTKTKELLKHDQELLYCNVCGHAQLKYILDSKLLYGETYSFRTSKSHTASRGSDFFYAFLKKLFPKKTFSRILEIGCNDAYLLKKLKPVATKLLGVDPIWKNREYDFVDPKIQISGSDIENCDVNSLLEGPPDLIVSQHTLEHLSDIRELFKNLLSLGNEDTVFLLEIPCFDILVQNQRFDQVFHQHLQYFSLQSTMKLIEQNQYHPIDYCINYQHWGALLIAFSRKRPSSSSSHQEPQKNSLTRKFIENSIEAFRIQIQLTSTLLESEIRQTCYGYGAALMLPVLGYHLNLNFSEFVGILDDDPDKHGLSYINLETNILNPAEHTLENSSVLLTALDNRRPIMQKLALKQARKIINPLPIM